MSELRVTVVTVLLLLAVGCGGGAGGANDDPVANLAPAQSGGTTTGSATGKVVVVIGDDTIQDWDQAVFEISRVLLLGGSDGQVVLLDEVRQIDFLALESVNEVLAATEVPADSYEKIRFEVDEITLIKLVDRDDPAMGVLEQVTVDQSSPKVDVVPRSEFTVGEDQSVILEIDVDLDKSIKAHKTGNGKWKFRPVIFADVLTVDQPGGLVRVFGADVQLPELPLADSGSFDLCDTRSLAGMDSLSNEEDCVQVVLGETTSIFKLVTEQDGRLTRVTVDDVADDDSAIVYGFLDPTADVVTLMAEIVALGSEDVYRIVECQATDAVVDEPPGFPCDRGGDGADDDDESIDIVLVEGAKLFFRNGDVADVDSIQDGVKVEAEGHEPASEMVGSTSLDAFVAILSEAAYSQVEGTLDAIDLANRELIVTDATDGVTQRCVRYDDDTVFFKIVNGDEQMEGSLVTVSEIESGVALESSGNIVEDCLLAVEIIFEVGEDG